MGTTNIDYSNILFETASLPHHTDKPTFEVIHGMHKTLNWYSWRPNKFRGGNQEYLDLLLSDAVYVLISPAPFVWPVHPGILVIPTGTAQHAATTMKKIHKEALRLFF